MLLPELRARNIRGAIVECWDAPSSCSTIGGTAVSTSGGRHLEYETLSEVEPED